MKGKSPAKSQKRAKPLNVGELGPIFARKPDAAASVQARTEGGATVIDMFGEIGPFGIRERDVAQILRDVNTSLIVVNVNSPGGDVFHGVAIYNLLAQHSAKVEVRVMGLAASAASLIAMAGDTVAMAPGSFLMIHNAWTVGIGDKNAMRELADTLDKVDGELAATYVAKSGMDLDDVTQAMDDETWYTADEAVEAGLADEVMGDDDEDTSARMRNFDYSNFRNVPKGLKAPKRSAKVKQKAAGTQPERDFSPVLAALERLNGCFKQ